MKLIISGGRNYSLSASGIIYLDEFFRQHKVKLVLNGRAKGIDTVVWEYCYKHNIPAKSFPAKWTDLKAEGCVIKYGKFGPYNANAGFARNKDMVDEALIDDGILVVFCGGNGSAHIHDYAIGKGLLVIDLRSRSELVVKL